jgi:hypothetical protein
MTDSSQETMRIFCNQCNHKTKHRLIYSKSYKESKFVETYGEVVWWTEYDMYECLGCEDITFRKKIDCSEWDPLDSVIVYFPPRSARRLPNWTNKLPNDAKKLLEEVYTAIQADSRSLAMMGSRALVDMIIIQKVGDVGTFAKKLKKLQDEGFISERNREVLDAALDVGSASAHRGYRPDQEKINIVMDIVENLLHATILQDETVDLKNSTPKRKK